MWCKQSLTGNELCSFDAVLHPQVKWGPLMRSLLLGVAAAGLLVPMVAQAGPLNLTYGQRLADAMEQTARV